MLRVWWIILQRWDGLIAVNYAARAHGVKHDSQEFHFEWKKPIGSDVKWSTRMCLYVGKPVQCSNDTSIVEARDEGCRCTKGMSWHHPGACGNHQRGNWGDSERSLETEMNWQKCSFSNQKMHYIILHITLRWLDDWTIVVVLYQAREKHNTVHKV